MRHSGINEPRFRATWHFLAMLLMCAAYLQGGIDKLLDFGAAVAELRQLGVTPAAPIAAIVIVLELGASILILIGRWRWLAALALAGFTLFASMLANRFWDAPLSARFAMENSFFEHLGLVGGFLLIAWSDLAESGG